MSRVQRQAVNRPCVRLLTRRGRSGRLERGVGLLSRSMVRSTWACMKMLERDEGEGIGKDLLLAWAPPLLNSSKVSAKLHSGCVSLALQNSVGRREPTSLHY